MSTEHACLIDSHTGLSFTRTALDVVVTDWAAQLQAAMPAFFDGDAHMDKAAQAAAKVGGWYTYNALDKSAATVVACLVTERLHGAYALSDFDDRSSIIDRVRPVAAFVASTDPTAMPSDYIYRVIVDVDACTIKEIIPPTGGTDPEWAPERALDADICYITFSSGSTGHPKGIYGSHRAVTHMNETRNALYPYAAAPNGEGSVWTVGVNIFLLWECFRPLHFGGCCVILRQSTFVDPEAFLNAVEKYKINELLFTASYAKLFLSHHLMKSADVKGAAFTAPACLKRVWQNGEPVTESLREAFLAFFPTSDVEVLNLYSISECYEVGHGNIRTDKAEMNTFPGIRIEFDAGKKNEVVVFSGSICHGYHKPSTDAEKGAFSADMTSYRTGDVGKLISDEGPQQRFVLDGRCSMFIRVKGRFLSLEQVEGIVERGLGLVGKGLATVEVDAETSELVAYIDGGFESDRLPDVRALCPFPEWMPDRFVRHAPTVRRPSPSGKANRATNNGAAAAGGVDGGFPTASDARTAEIKRVLLDHIGVDVDFLSKPMSLRDLGISSLSILRLREALKTEAGIDMSVGELYKIADVRKFVAETFTPDMLYSEVELVVTSTKDAPGYAGNAAEDAAPRGYFITGATGFLGGWVANTVATSDPDAVVYILSRRSDEETRAVFEKKGLTMPKNSVIIRGDTSAAGFGMTAETIADVQRSVKYYIHCAAHVVFGCSYAEARPSTVMGANHLLTIFMGSHPAAELHYISTNGVYPPYFTRDTRRACLETQEDFPLYASRLKEGYGWSKWVAEKSVFDVCRARSRSVRAYRPGNIGWAHDGRYNPIDFQTLIVFACRALNCVPDVASWNFEMSPVDDIARLIVGNCGTAPAQPVAHNVIGQRTPMDFYLDAAIPRAPMEEWLTIAAAYAEKHAATKGDPANAHAARDLDAVEQTRASFEEYVTLDMYLSDTNDYFTHNTQSYAPTRAYADSIA